MSDLKVYCTKDWYRDYLITGRLIACSPSTRNNLLLEDREAHNDLNVRLSIDKRSHEISEIDAEYMGEELKPEGDFYDIIKR